MSKMVQIRNVPDDLHRWVDSPPVLRLAAASHCSAYGCEFVALAQDLGVPLVTADRRLLARFPGTAVSLRGFAAGGRA